MTASRATRRRSRAAPAPAAKKVENRGLLDEIRVLQKTVDALIAQMSLAMQTLTLLRAEQQRLVEQVGLGGPAGRPDVRSCAQPDSVEAHHAHGRRRGK